jgi:sugar phosphate isomerase/epimerase
VFRLVAKRPFGVSTHLYQRQRLCRAHLLEIAAHGFELVEVVASRAHFDYHSPAAIADLQQWIAEAGLSLAAIHAAPGATPDEVERALFVARRIPVPALVVHVGGSRKVERRNLARFADLAAPLGVRVAVETGDNALSKTGPLTYFVEHDLEDTDVGICLDFGRAHLDGDLVDAIETSSEHLIATHVHDNRGRTDEHLVPFEGSIDWPAALTTVQKVGYDGPIVLEVDPRGPTREMLTRLRAARLRLEKLFAN